MSKSEAATIRTGIPETNLTGFASFLRARGYSEFELFVPYGQSVLFIVFVDAEQLSRYRKDLAEAMYWREFWGDEQS